MKSIFTAAFLSCALSFTANAQWISQPAGFSTPVMVYEMEAVSPTVIWAAGADSVNNIGQAYVKSVDGGQTWQTGGINNVAADFIVNNITATDANTAWVAMVDETNGGGLLKKTTDGGQTWVTQGANTFTDAASYPDVIHFFDANNGVVFGDPVNGYWEIYSTANGGTTWTRRPMPSVPNVIAGAFGDEYGMFAKAAKGNTIWTGTSEGRILRSTDKGLTWTAVSTTLDGIKALDFTDPFNGLAMSPFGELATTTDGGITWTTITPQGNVYDYDLAALPNTPGVFVTTGFIQSGYAGSSYTLDGGLNWMPLDSMPHMAVAFADASNGWSTGMNSTTTYRWSSGVLGISKTQELQVAKLFPNPSTGTFYLNEPEALKSLTITDMTGRRFLTTGNVPGNYQLNLGHLPKGVYRLMVTTAKTTKTQRLVLN